jgi:hypothetical protein
MQPPPLLPLLTAAALLAGCAVKPVPPQSAPVEPALTRAIEFLTREVPAWRRDNGCFSCHNNGDAARALFTARAAGFPVPADATADTLDWLAQPARWNDNKGDPGFSDQRLADVQFAAALLTARTTGHALPTAAPAEAARRLLATQAADGSWPVDTANRAGSPATYGTTLATFMAWRALDAIELPGAAQAAERAASALLRVKPSTVPDAATLLRFAMLKRGAEVEALRGAAREFLETAQNGDGGWGPYRNAPSEPFDTALAVLALAEDRNVPQVKARIERGVLFLAATQLADGSWPATTRPPGGISYAQQMSTTGWAALALLASRGR